MRSTRRVAHLAAVAVLGLSLAACGSSSGDAGSGPATSAGATLTAADLEGATYVSTTVTGHDLVAGTDVRLEFADGRMMAAAGCNTMSGPFSLDAGTLAWTGHPMTTMIGCDSARAAQDTWLTDLLTKGMAVTGAADAPTLTSGSVTIALSRKAAADASSLLGTTWTVTGTTDGSTAATVPAGVRKPTLTIAADGGVTIDTGCNTGRSTVTASGTTLTFDHVAMTRKACASDEASAVEAAVLQTLVGAVEVSGEESSVALTHGHHGLTLTPATS